MVDLRKIAGEVSGNYGLNRLSTTKVFELYPQGVTLTNMEVITGEYQGKAFYFVNFKFLEDTTSVFSTSAALTKVVDKWLERVGGDVDAINEYLAANPMRVKIVRRTSKKTGNSYFDFKVVLDDESD